MDFPLQQLIDISSAQKELLTNQATQQKILEKNSELLEAQAATLLRNTLTLEEHHRRTSALEEVVELEKNKIATLEAKSQKFQGVIDVIKWLSGISGVGTVAYQILTKWVMK